MSPSPQGQAVKPEDKKKPPWEKKKPKAAEKKQPMEKKVLYKLNDYKMFMYYFRNFRYCVNCT